MSDRVFRKLGLTDLQMLVNTKKDAEALHIWQVDEESARLFFSNPMNYFFACVEDNKIIGYACGYEINRLDNAGNMLYIHGVGVHADFQRQGIAEKMLISLKETCKLLGISKFFLFTQKSNIAACSLYEKLGGQLSSPKDDDRTYFFKPEYYASDSNCNS